MKWFRVYSEIKDDPKMLELDDHQRWLWICLMATANESSERGTIQNVRIRGLAAALRTDADRLSEAITLFVELGMIEYNEQARTIMLLHFTERQYDKPSDTPEQTRDRKVKSRLSHANVTPSHANVTPSHATYTDTDTDTEEREKELPAPSAPNPIPAMTSGNGNGHKEAKRMSALNDKLGPELRRVLAEALLQIVGSLELANTETEAGQAALYAAHEAAIAMHQMGYKTAEDLLPAEDAWYESDFRGKRGERPTLKQFIEQCSKTKAGARNTGAKPAEEWR